MKGGSQLLAGGRQLPSFFLVSVRILFGFFGAHLLHVNENEWEIARLFKPRYNTFIFCEELKTLRMFWLFD